MRDGDRTVITMVNDFRGDPKEFAVVVPVPTFIQKGQIHVGDKKIVDHLDAYTSPRLVEYYDENPCGRARLLEMEKKMARDLASPMTAGAKSVGVKIEAQYTVGEYDIVILSARESDGLEAWLKENGYRIPGGAADVLGSYIRQKMRFFVAKVNLDEHSRLGYNTLRPLQVAYESPKFMLPIRLGTINADGPQELFIYTLTRRGRVETANYRTVKLPSDVEIPVYVKNEFADFYRAMFDRQVQKEEMRAIFLEYAWDMNWCDPCAAEPLSVSELSNLGVFWLDEGPGASPSGSVMPPWRRPLAKSEARDVFVTRLHVRYDGKRFPEDLVFQETADRTNIQGRYILRHAWNGPDTCPLAAEYRRNVLRRHEHEAQTLARLTGWDMNKIRERIGINGARGGDEERSWWQRLWK